MREDMRRPTPLMGGSVFSQVLGEVSAEAWPLAVAGVAIAVGCAEETACAFLDSPLGGTFAREIKDGLDSGQSLFQAVVATAVSWCLRQVGSAEANLHGLPMHVPLLPAAVLRDASPVREQPGRDGQ